MPTPLSVFVGYLLPEFLIQQFGITTALEFRHGPSALLAKSGFSEALRFLCSSGPAAASPRLRAILHVRSYPERSGSPHARQASATSADLAFHSVLERQAPQALVGNVTWLRTGIAESRDLKCSSVHPDRRIFLNGPSCAKSVSIDRTSSSATANSGSCDFACGMQHRRRCQPFSRRSHRSRSEGVRRAR